MPGVWRREREPAGTRIVFPAEQLMASVFMCGMEDLLFSGSRFVWTATVAALRRWYAGRLRACRQTLRAWCGLRDVYQVKHPGDCSSLDAAHSPVWFLSAHSPGEVNSIYWGRAQLAHPCWGRILGRLQSELMFSISFQTTICCFRQQCFQTAVQQLLSNSQLCVSALNFRLGGDAVYIKCILSASL